MNTNNFYRAALLNARIANAQRAMLARKDLRAFAASERIACAMTIGLSMALAASLVTAWLLAP